MKLKIPTFFSFLLLFMLFSVFFFFLAYRLISKVATLPLDGLDFRAFYTAIIMLKHGVSNNFYNLSTQFFWQNTIFNLPSKSYLMPFLNPPFIALFFVPLANLPIRYAYLFFSLINTVLAIIAFFLLTISVGKKSFVQTIVLFLFFICFSPIWIAILQGQWSFFLLISFIAASYFFPKNKKFLAGVSFAVLLIRPNLLILPILLLIIKKQWKILTGFGFGFFVLTVISCLLIGFNGIKNYLLLLSSTPFWGDKLTIHPTLEPTLRGFLQVLLHTNSLLPVLPLFIFGSVLSLFLVRKSLLNFNFGALITITLFTSIHTNYHDLVLLLLPCVFILMKIKKIQLMIFVACIMSFLVNLSYLRPESTILLFIFILFFYTDYAPIVLRKSQFYLRKLLDPLP